MIINLWRQKDIVKYYLLKLLESQVFLKPGPKQRLTEALFPQQEFKQDIYIAKCKNLIKLYLGTENEQQALEKQLLTLALILSGEYSVTKAQFNELITILTPSDGRHKTTEKIMCDLIVQTFRGQLSDLHVDIISKANSLEILNEKQQVVLDHMCHYIDVLLEKPAKEQPDVFFMRNLFPWY